MPSISNSISPTAGCYCGSERTAPCARRRRSISYAVTQPMTCICTKCRIEHARRRPSRASAFGSFVFSTGEYLSNPCEAHALALRDARAKTRASRVKQALIKRPWIARASPARAQQSLAPRRRKRQVQSMYAVKEIYYTLQGEGAQAGRPAVFCRFAGCNLWSGREEDRASAVCRFCDTDFVGTDGENGGKYRD